MNIDFLAFDSLHHLGESATHPLIRLVVRLPLSLLVVPQGDSDPLLRAKARVESYASPGLPPTRKGQAGAVKPLKRQQPRSRRFAAVSGVVGGLAALRIRRPPCGGTRPNAPSGASTCGFQV